MMRVAPLQRSQAQDDERRKWPDRGQLRAGGDHVAGGGHGTGGDLADILASRRDRRRRRVSGPIRCLASQRPFSLVRHVPVIIWITLGVLMAYLSHYLETTAVGSRWCTSTPRPTCWLPHPPPGAEVGVLGRSADACQRESFVDRRVRQGRRRFGCCR